MISEIIAIISKCAKKIETKIKLHRIKCHLDDENVEKVDDVCTIIIKSTVWHLVELLNALYHMCVNDSIKYDIYFTNEMSHSLRSIIFNGSPAEIEYSLKLLYQLCFDKRIANDILADKKLFEFISNLVNETDRATTKRQCEGILWLIEDKSKQKSNTNKHVMISYNRENRDLCVAIKKHLESAGFKIWIDIDNIHGSSLEAMALAVENSSVILICMTEKYKQSSNCRAEAEYAFQLNKPIVPLIMQAKYKPDGW